MMDDEVAALVVDNGSGKLSVLPGYGLFYGLFGANFGSVGGRNGL